MVIKGEVEKNVWLDTDGSFTAKLINVEEKQFAFDPALQFTFEILVDSTNEGKQVTGLTSKRVTPDNKTAKWIKALDPNFDPEIGRTFDFDYLKEKVCRILVEQNKEYFNVVKCRALKPEELVILEKVKKPTPAPVEKKEEKKEKPKTTPADADIDF